MTRVRVKGFQIFTDRHGKIRCYHRITRTPVDLRIAALGSAEFFAECARITELTRMAGPPKPGTLGLLIEEYRASPSFGDLAVRTRSDYQRCLDCLNRSVIRPSRVLTEVLSFVSGTRLRPSTVDGLQTT